MLVGRERPGSGDRLQPILSHYTTYSNNTAAYCQSQCKVAGYFYAGGSGTTCACGNRLEGDIQSCGTLAMCVSRLKPKPLCNVMCPGDAEQLCGGTASRMSIHAVAALVLV